MTPMRRFLTMSGIASSERTFGQSFDVEIRERRIGDEHGLAGGSGAVPVTPWPTADAQALGNLGRITHLKTDVEFLARLVEQQDGEDFVVDDLADEFGDAAKRGFEIERGVDDVRHFEQQGFHL